MRKAQEIELLREVAVKLGPDSYCGPWLASVADEVEQQVRGDFFPTPSIAATIEVCEKLKADAKEAALLIQADARTKGDKMIREVEARISSIKDCAVIQLRSALQQLEGRV